MRLLALPVRVALVVMILAVNAFAQPIEYLSTGGDNDMLAPLPFATLAVEPVSAPDGSIYYNTAMVSFRCRVSGAWQSCALASGGAGVIDVGTTNVTSAGNCAVLYNDSGVVGAETVFCWDETNNRLGVNQSSPLYTLDVNGTSRTTGQALFTWPPGNTGLLNSSLLINPATCTTGRYLLGLGVNGTEFARFDCGGNSMFEGTAWNFGGLAGNRAAIRMSGSNTNYVIGSNGLDLTATSPGFISYGSITAGNGWSFTHGNSSLTARLAISNDGTNIVRIGNSSGANGRLVLETISGFLNLGATGTAASPGVRLGGVSVDEDTGLYRPALNQIGFSTGGVSRMIIADATTTISNTAVFQSSTNNTNCTLNALTGSCTATVTTNCVNPQCTPRTFLVGAAQIACSVSGTTLTAQSAIGDSRVVHIFCP